MNGRPSNPAARLPANPARAEGANDEGYRHSVACGRRCFPVPSPVLPEALYSDDASVTIDLAFVWSIDGDGLVLPASLPGEGEILTTATFFRSDANGVWRFEAEGLSPDCDPLRNPFCGYGVVGVNGVWTRVPAPSTLVLLGVGLAGLASLRRRKAS